MQTILTYLWLFIHPFIIGLDVENTDASEHIRNKETYTLTVSFSNINERWYGKKMYLAVWKSGTKGFPEKGTQDAYTTFWVKSYTKSGSFELSKGDYAVSCYLDLNGNKELDYNFWGAPTEPYCFSNNFTPSFSAPDFSDCQFSLSADQEIKLRLLH